MVEATTSKKNVKELRLPKLKVVHSNINIIGNKLLDTLDLSALEQAENIRVSNNINLYTLDLSSLIIVGEFSVGASNTV